MASIVTDPARKSSSEGLWSCPDYSKLVIERFDDEFLIYNRGSGETHVLNRESKLIIDAVYAAPTSPENVKAALSCNTADSPGVSVEQIKKHLAILEQWGIVRLIR